MNVKTRLERIERRLQGVKEAGEEFIVFEPVLICRRCHPLENEGGRVRCPLLDGAETCPGMVST